MRKLDYSLKLEDFNLFKPFNYLNRIEKQIGNIDLIELPEEVKKRESLNTIINGFAYGLLNFSSVYFVHYFEKIIQS